MPIRPENKHRYPKDWKQVRERILKRAGYRCEHPGCSARQYAVGCWHRPGGGAVQWLGLWGQNDNPRTYAEARQVAAEESFSRFGDEPVPRGEPPIIVIVLTIAHLDHTPENCADDNLRALCQRHHLAHDAEHHVATAYRTRKAAACTPDLFESNQFTGVSE